MAAPPRRRRPRRPRRGARSCGGPAGALSGGEGRGETALHRELSAVRGTPKLFVWNSWARAGADLFRAGVGGGCGDGGGP